MYSDVPNLHPALSPSNLPSLGTVRSLGKQPGEEHGHLDEVYEREMSHMSNARCDGVLHMRA